MNLESSFESKMALSINTDHKTQGIFMDEAVRTSHVKTVKLIPISKNEFFINGHQNGGMQDLKIIVTETDIMLIDGAAKFKGKIQPIFELLKTY